MYRKALAIFALICIYTAPAFAANILVISSYHSSFPWTRNYLAGIASQLTPEHDISLFELDTKRIPLDEFTDKADEAFAMYKDTSPALVILADDNACLLLGERLLKEGASIVFLGMNNNPRKYNFHNNRNVAGIIERPLIKRISFLNDMGMGQVRQVLFMFDNSPTSQIIRKEMLISQDIHHLGNIEMHFRFYDSYENWMTAVATAKLNKYDAIFIGLYQRVYDKNGLHIPNETLLKDVVSKSEIPCFGLWEFSVGKGKAIGGLVLSGYEHGKEAGMLTKKILAGHSPQPHIQEAERGLFIFSHAELKRWQLNLSPALRKKAILID